MASRVLSLLLICVLILLVPLTLLAAAPPSIEGNAGVPGLLAEIDTLETLLTDQNATIEEL